MTQTEALAKYLTEHVYRDGFPISIEEARNKVADHAAGAPDDTYVALLTDRPETEVYGLGTTPTDVLDHGSDLLYRRRVPAAVLHYDGSKWNAIDVEYRMEVAR